MIYIISGKAEQWVGQQKKILGPGDMAFIPMGEIHGTWNVGDEMLVFLAILSPAKADEPGSSITARKSRGSPSAPLSLGGKDKPLTRFIPMTTRRSFFATAGAASLSGCELLRSKSGGDHIDAHVHVWTPEVEKYPLARGYAVSDMRPPSFTPEQLFAHCRPEGVRRIVLIQMSYYQYRQPLHAGCDEGSIRALSAAWPSWMNTRKIWRDDAHKLVKQGVRGFRI
jgi:hypothetical protein